MIHPYIYVALPWDKQAVVRGDISPKEQGTTTPSEVVARICHRADMTVAQLQSKSRRQYLVNVRKVVCHYLWHVREVSRNQLAAILNRDRRSTYDLIDGAEDLLVVDPKFRRQYQTLTQGL